MQRADGMIIRRHQEIIAWQLARKLERKVWAFTATEPAKGDLDYCKQIRKSTSSAARNIAEGFGRFWPGEFAHKIRISIGELREAVDDLERGRENSYMSEREFDEMFTLADRAIGAATRFVEYLETHGEEWKKTFRRLRRERGKSQPEASDF